MTAPLKGLRVIEIASIGPAPFGCMMLADHGAEVIRIERPVDRAVMEVVDAKFDVLRRGRTTIHVDLKTPEGVATVRELVRTAEVFVEGFRPGVMERLGLGPDVLLGDNPRLAYARMTGWGQDGPLAHTAGHDINYIALGGALHAIGRAGAKPTPPLNLVGDFGGGGMMLAFGVLAAVMRARATGEGQVIDCAMVDGTASLMAMIWGMRAGGVWSGARGTNLLDSGAHFYDSYETADGKFVAVGAIEPQFYALLREKLGLTDDAEFDAQNDPEKWPPLREKLAQRFKMQTQAHWCALFEGSDACFAPVLGFDDMAAHPHIAARGIIVDVDGVPQPAPAPRFSVHRGGSAKDTI